MINLGSTDFLLAIPSLPAPELQHLSNSLFDRWESFIGDSVSIPDYSLFLQVEEGSVKGAARIGAVLGAVYIGIGQYGSFVSGLKTINEQVKATGEYLTTQASHVFSCPPSLASAKNKGGSLAALQRLFVRVQKGDLTPEQAMARAEKILGDDSESSHDFMRKLAEAFITCPRHHQQQPFPFLEDREIFEVLVEENIPTNPRPIKPTSPVLGPPLHLRVEVWRDSKKKQKHTRIVKF